MIAEWFVGHEIALPAAMVRRHPELLDARWRVGGLPPRIAGLFLGRRSVAGITLWRTVFLAPGLVPSADLLLHELGHVRQFGSSRLFPLRYLLESARRGYCANRYEREAQEFADERLRAANISTSV
ncbi:MAG TPA: hypothetical protein VHM30_04700 [Gemmatimonadaceae bacterium]|nr:hypothetical protein [Gemmatimonadaceae bacterium]